MTLCKRLILDYDVALSPYNFKNIPYLLSFKSLRAVFRARDFDFEYQGFSHSVPIQSLFYTFLFKPVFQLNIGVEGNHSPITFPFPFSHLFRSLGLFSLRTKNAIAAQTF